MPDTERDAAIGSVVAGRYRIIREIGRGGMGTVYEAEHTYMRRRVALKVMRAELTGDTAMAARFQREAQAACQVSSPHVVTTLDFGVAEDGTLYLAMELLDGESLGERLDRGGALSISIALDIGASVARALEAAHEAGVVHRDLKPDNIMLSSEGVKVVDFGIAKLLDADTGGVGAAEKLTHVGAIIGTPTYMSPEACARKSVGPAADIYALGAIVFQMIVGRPVFEEAEMVFLMGMHLRAPPEHLEDVVGARALPPGLDELVDSMLAKDPASRPDAASVAGALSQMPRIPEEPTASIDRAVAAPGVGGQETPRALSPARRRTPRAAGFAAVALSLGFVGASATAIGFWVSEMASEQDAAPVLLPGVAPSPAAEPAPSIVVGTVDPTDAGNDATVPLAFPEVGVVTAPRVEPPPRTRRQARRRRSTGAATRGGDGLPEFEPSELPDFVPSR